MTDQSDILSSLPSESVADGRDLHRDPSFDEYVDKMQDSATFNDENIIETDPLATATAAAATAAAATKKDAKTASTSNGGGNWSHKRSFLAESPYFSAFVEKEMHELNIVTSVLEDISNRTRDFTRYGHLMADATLKLSLSCRLRKEEAEHTRTFSPHQADQEIEKRRAAIGPEISDLLGILGETLEEIASAQMTMTNIFDATLSKALDSFVQADMRGVKMMKQEADSQTLAAEQMFNKYITSKPTLSPLQDDHINGGEHKHGNPPSRSGFTKLWRRGSSNGAGSYGGDPTLDKAIAAANWRLNVEELSLNQATAELKRFQFTKLLLDVKNRRNLELSAGVVASAGAMQNCFKLSLDKMEQPISMMTKIEDRQREARQAHQKIEMPVWLERMNLIVRVLSAYQGSAAEASQVAYAVAAGDPMLIDKQTTDINMIEKEAGLWEVPFALARSSRYRRELPSGVIHEGWLYQKNSSMMGPSWSRRWFVLRRDGIYCLESSAELKKENTGHSTTKVKICDVVLCTVREIPDDSTGRFRFDLIAPRQKPLMLMAPGPTEMATWVKYIRRGVEKQLIYGDAGSSQLHKNIGKMKRDRRSTEIASTIVQKESPLAMQENFMENFDEECSEDENDECVDTRPLVKMVFEKNDTCADCGKPDPDWVSLNLGILVCLECSGVHRSLGVHVSKVRSLTLDTFSDTEARLLLAFGNDNANRIWEETLEGKNRLNESDERDVRDKFIKNKYLMKDFLASAENMSSQQEANWQLYEAAKCGNLMGIARALAHGADVEWKNDQDGGKTPLHACAVCPRGEGEWMAIECAELLIQNGAEMKVMDQSSHNVLDCAVLGSADRDMIEYLLSKFE